MSNNSNIRDNNMYGTVAEFLQDKIEDGSCLSFVSAYFTINAFHQLKDKLTNIESLRFLFGEPTFIQGLDPTKTESKVFSLESLRFLFGEPTFIQGLDPTKTESKVFSLTERGLKLGNYLLQKEIAKACAEWIEDKVEIRENEIDKLVYGLYDLTDDEIAIVEGSV